MRTLMWMVFLLGAVLSWIFLGLAGRIIYFLAVGFAILLFRRQMSIGLTHAASKLGLMRETIDRMPQTITLTRSPAADELAGPAAKALSAVGFVDAGAWSIPGMPKIHLMLMVHTSEHFLAAIESATAFGAQVNVHTLYAGGALTTYTNSRLPAPPSQRPGVTSMRMPGAEPGALFTRARAERRRDGILPVTAQEAPRIYERLYAESIRYRKARGS